jgi:hypothetical protein
MKVASFEAIVRALNEAGVHYLVVGGLAVISHGYGRATYDIDLVTRLTPEAATKAFKALATIDYRPTIPVTPEEFADPTQREAWRREKNMTVLRFWSEGHRESPVDVFIYAPFDFESEYDAAELQEVAPGLIVRIVRLQTLLEMKRVAGRGIDLADIDELNLLHGRPSSYDREKHNGN